MASRDGWSGPWCIGEDFNEILYPQERSSGLCPMNTMLEFHDFINHVALVDLRFRGVIIRGLGVVGKLFARGWTASWFLWTGRNNSQTHFRQDCQGLSQIISQ